MPSKAPLGADLIIPALALGFAIYFFWSIADLAWEAKANGVVIGIALIVLVVIQAARIGLAVAQGRGDLGTGTLWQPRDVLLKHAFARPRRFSPLRPARSSGFLVKYAG